MITHGNKQISEIVYARKASEGGGAVRITNIIRGAQVVFGDLIPRLAWQLLGATKAAILAAFGQTDGKAVIKATNAYLNALAATDPTKASALAGFINEDPMLVCSLVETGKTRWLVGDGKAYINTGITPSLTMKLSGIYKMPIISQYKGPFGSYVNEASNCTRICSNYGSDKDLLVNFMTKAGGGGIIVKGVTSSANEPVNFEMTYEGGNFNGVVSVFQHISGNDSTQPIFLFGQSPSYMTLTDWDKFVVKVSEVTKANFLPFIRQGANGMIDTLTGTFYPNANTSGSFTIEYTLPDGTPWTPLNQTP